MALTSDILLDKLKEFLGEDLISSQESFGMLAITVSSNRNYQLLEFLNKESSILMSFLTDIAGAHYPDRKGQELEVIYHLHSLINNVRLRIKCSLPVEKPEVNSVVALYSAANFMERETYDFYGIIFTGHPNLKRILNVDEMDYFPMRKEYPLEDQTRTDKEDKYFGR
jgi:NADH-quinone oxidoreductase subunit C